MNTVHNEETQEDYFIHFMEIYNEESSFRDMVREEIWQWISERHDLHHDDDWSDFEDTAVINLFEKVLEWDTEGFSKNPRMTVFNYLNKMGKSCNS